MRPLRVLLLCLLATSAFALEVPPSPTQWFTDRANVVDSSSAAALNEKLRNFEQQRGAQFIIYIFPSLENESMEDFTIRCAETWKAGNKKYDNGLILFVFVNERKIRIEVGYGLEGTVTDAVSSRVISEDMAHRFRQGDYAGGLNAAAEDLIARISSKEAPVAPVQSSGRYRGRGNINGCAVPPVVLLFLFIFVLFILPRLFMSRTSRSSGCGGCFWPLFFMSGGGRGSTFGGGGWGGGGGGGFGGFSGGGGSFGGGGASGGW